VGVGAHPTARVALGLIGVAVTFACLERSIYPVNAANDEQQSPGTGMAEGLTLIHIGGPLGDDRGRTAKFESLSLRERRVRQVEKSPPHVL
jgi:hypothetical protein